jgi:DNA-directed RNA polymerase subunit M/transcription elongation factor TFIIS
MLQPLNEEQVMIMSNNQTIAERMGTEEALCPECGKNEWWFLPTRSVAVKEGGKHYCECLGCGYQTHL